MSRIAIFSDVHGNLPALATVLQDIDNKAVDQVFCLGDLTDFAPWTNEVIDTIKSRHISCIMGNHDERIAFDHPVIRLQKHQEEEAAARIKAIDYTKATITGANKKYLAGLPAQLRLRFSWPGISINLLLVHGSPASNDEYIYEDHPEPALLRMLEQQQATILVTGHTHLPYIRKIAPQVGMIGQMVINCGSVGRSKEKKPLASYLLLEISPQEVNAAIIKLAYPVNETIAAIRSSGIPDFYADFLAGTATELAG